jgi:hypothetical protein
MMMRIAPIRVISFVLMAACGGVCQSERPSVDLLQRDVSGSPEVHKKMRTRKLPPSVASPQGSKPPGDFLGSVNGAPSPLTGAAGINLRTICETQLNCISARPKPLLYAPFQAVSSPRKATALLDKYLYPSLSEPSLRYHSSTNGSLIGRAAYAASRILVTRDAFGKSRLNTSYLLRALASMASAAAARPYWRRSPGEPFGDFVSTIGNESGMNLWREFRPGIEKLMKSHTPRFVSKIKERLDPK